MTGKRARAAAPKSGTCRLCGCTDEFGCDSGCSWVDPDHTLCSRCCPPAALQLEAALKRCRGLLRFRVTGAVADRTASPAEREAFAEAERALKTFGKEVHGA